MADEFVDETDIQTSNIDELRNQSPSLKDDLQITKRTLGDMTWSGSNDFKLKSINNTIKRRIIFKLLIL